jgi:predicted MFS family arabinose efflux permease
MASRSAIGGIGRALGNRSFRQYFYGLTGSTTGFWGYRVALGWQVWELTHSPAWLGGIVFVEVVPMLLLGPVGGTVVDQHGALKMTRITQACWAAVLSVLTILTFAGLTHISVLLVIAFVQGAIAGFSNPGHLALVAKIVPREDLSPAVALQSGIVQTGRFIGPMIAGPLLVAYGPGMVYALVAVAFIFAAINLWLVQTREVETSGDSRGFRGDFADGVRYTMNHFAIRTIILYTAIMSFLLRPVIELLPGFSDVVFGRGAEGLAWLLSSFGLGSLISAIYVAVRGETKGLTHIFIVNLIVGAVSLLAFSFTANFYAAMACTIVVGMSTNTVSIISQILAQHMVAGHMRARVMSILGTTFRAVPAGGALFQGWAASALGLEMPVAIASGVCILAWGRLVQIARTRDLARQTEEPGEV